MKKAKYDLCTAVQIIAMSAVNQNILEDFQKHKWTKLAKLIYMFQYGYQYTQALNYSITYNKRHKKAI